MIHSVIFVLGQNKIIHAKLYDTFSRFRIVSTTCCQQINWRGPNKKPTMRGLFKIWKKKLLTFIQFAWPVGNTFTVRFIGQYPVVSVWTWGYCDTFYSSTLLWTQRSSTKTTRVRKTDTVIIIFNSKHPRPNSHLFICVTFWLHF